MNLLREYIRELLKEDPLGFVNDLAGSGMFQKNVIGGSIGKEAGREIKRAFNNNADHQWLSTLDTVHWTPDVYIWSVDGLGPTSGKDELSATMTLPGKPLKPAVDGWNGLWIKGRITLAANDQDAIYSGFYGDYGRVGGAARSVPPGAEEEVAHRDKSSGRNKRPSVSKDYSAYSELTKMWPQGAEMRAQKGVPYILDQSTWDPSKNQSGVNEALVDNWRAVGIVVANKSARLVKYYANSSSLKPAIVEDLLRAAADFGVPIFDVNRNELWRPE